MRLIDADKLVALLNKKYGDDENVNESVLYLVGAISGMPTVYADDVVRCEDCRWATAVEHEFVQGADIHCQKHNCFTNHDSYCSSGERR